jgi:hypothetical protein
MGEIAEMMLDGTLCEGCGEYMGDECGYARRCHYCRKMEKQYEKERATKKGSQKNLRKKEEKRKDKQQCLTRSKIG